MEHPQQEQPTASAFYAKVADARELRADPVPRFELYKVLREEELLAYRALVRIFAMHGAIAPVAGVGASSASRGMSKAQQRLLEDLREMMCVAEARHEAEILAVEADPVIAAVRDAGVAANRAPFFDGVSDVPVPAPATAAAATGTATSGAVDDGFGPMVPAAVVPGQQRVQHGAGGMVGRGGSKKAPAAAAAAIPAQQSTHVAASKTMQEIERVGQEAKGIAERLVRAEALDERQQLKTILQEKQAQLQQIRSRLLASDSPQPS